MMMMKRIALLITITLTAFLVTFAQTVDEPKTRAFFDGNDLVAEFVIDSASEATPKITLAVVDANDRILVQTVAKPKLQKGANKVVFRTPFGIVRNVDDLIWKRLRYTISNVDSEKTGFVSFSTAMADLFDLEANSWGWAMPGSIYVVRVDAQNPVTRKPVPNVELSGSLKIAVMNGEDEETLVLKSEGITDSTGFAVLHFDVPDGIRIDDDSYRDTSVSIDGKKSGVFVSASTDLNTLFEKPRILINTDKPLYQPGQTIHIRGLATESKSSKRVKPPVVDTEVEFRIQDEDETTLYRETVTTSRFGIAGIEWQIPENAKLGRYSVEIELKDYEATSYASFRVSRYELPNFVVNTKPDKPYYLPKEKKAKVKIDATYLFGKPVVAGKVRVVRETERTWNFSAQEWDISEEEEYEGELDDKSVWEAKIDLKEAHDELKEDDDLFKDLNFTAYVTDSTTNITEQQRFDLRVSKEDIHVYFVGLSEDDHNDKLPLRFYVTTSLADGTPVSADVELKGAFRDEGKRNTIQKIRTNRFGAAKVELKLPKCPEFCSDYFELEALAKDGQKRRGSKIEDSISIEEDQTELQLKIAKTVLRKGEPIEIELFSNAKDKRVAVDASSGLATVRSSNDIKLVNGYAKLLIPYNKEFAGRITIDAYFREDGDTVSAYGGVFYPSPESLAVELATEKETYRPAERVALNYDVKSPAGPTGETAIGVYILDRAVEERALTDSNFGGAFDPFGFFRQALGGTQSFGGISIADVEKLDLDKPVDPDIGLATEIMLFNTNIFTEFYDADLSVPRSEFRAAIASQMGVVSIPLNLRYSADFFHPTNFAEFDRLLKDNDIDFASLRDPWGQPYLVRFSIERDKNVVTVISTGPDKIEDDDEDEFADDDFEALKLTFDYFTETGQKIDKALEKYTERTGTFVRDEKTLAIALLESGINIADLKDRWGEPYRFKFEVDRRNYIFRVESIGPSKNKSYKYDDFQVWRNNTDYFTKVEAKIYEILSAYIGKTKSYPADEKAFKKVLREGGMDFDSLRDGWGRPFYLEFNNLERFTDRVEIQTTSLPGDKLEQRFVITPVTQKTANFQIRSSGETGKKDPTSWQNPYIARFSGVVSEQAKDENNPGIVVPKALVQKGKGAIYGTVTDQTGAVIPGATVKATNITLDAERTVTTDESGSFLIGDLPAGDYSLSVESAGFKRHVVRGIKLASETISNISVSLESGLETVTVDVSSDSSSVINTTDTKIDTNISKELIESLPLGTTFGSLLKIAPGVVSQPLGAGFQIDGASGAENVFIIDGQEVTKFKTGAINPSNNIRIITKSGTTGFEAEYGAAVGGVVDSQPRSETPRVRNYFPETLLWAPEIVTDKDGKVTVKFQLADNITTWKIYSVASNLEGRIGVSEKEIKTFQPFFVDLLPPRILTKGDEISLPVQVRNYTDQKQSVEVSLRGEKWFEIFKPKELPSATSSRNPASPTPSPDSTFLNIATNIAGLDAASASTRSIRPAIPSASIEKVNVDANATGNAVFDFRATDTTRDGIMHVTATAADESDAIEKPVAVNPDGKEIVHSETSIFQEDTSFDVAFPENSLSGTQEAEVKIYPNLFAHVAESVFGLLQRPYGCGEQTVSSTYPNLMILKFTKEDNNLRKTAKVYLQKGYERLLGYQTESGGFSYWGGNDKPDVALTAYALRFLSDARAFIDVDETTLKRAKSWLAENQNPNGTWSTRYDTETSENFGRTLKITTYVVRALAETVTDEDSGSTNSALEMGLLRLKQDNASIDEPYSLANLGLAYAADGEPEKAAEVAKRVSALAKREGQNVYWNLETNTPFFGWGTAGRIETTALVVQLLQKVKTGKNNSELVSGGISFLLKNKDRYGVWYSTQATINVLEAFSVSLSPDSDDDTEETKSTATVFVNGEKVKDIELPPANEPGVPIMVGLTGKLSANSNKIEVKTAAKQTLQAQVVARHYINWSDFVGSDRDISSSRQLALDYSCDKYNAKPTEEVSCKVKAERVGFQGYGMLLAEIGIPPGADVDRASLDRAKKEDWSFSRYDVLPDRIIVYMWSKAGGSEFGFKFKPRYGINAQTPASTVYDYYNEEAKAIVRPMRFVIR